MYHLKDIRHHPRTEAPHDSIRPLEKRPPVLRYRAFCDEVRLKGLTLPDSGYHVTFVLPMPESWSMKKRKQYSGQPHQQKPDKDNLEKALLDAIFTDDCRIWDGRVTKLWGEKGQILIDF